MERVRCLSVKETNDVSRSRTKERKEREGGRVTFGFHAEFYVIHVLFCSVDAVLLSRYHV